MYDTSFSCPHLVSAKAEFSPHFLFVVCRFRRMRWRLATPPSKLLLRVFYCATGSYPFMATGICWAGSPLASREMGRQWKLPMPYGGGQRVAHDQQPSNVSCENLCATAIPGACTHSYCRAFRKNTHGSSSLADEQFVMEFVSIHVECTLIGTILLVLL